MNARTTFIFLSVLCILNIYAHLRSDGVMEISPWLFVITFFTWSAYKIKNIKDEKDEAGIK